MVIKQFNIYLIDLNPTQEHEINKARPCVVISPNEMNAHLQTLIIAPMTSKAKVYPTRVNIQFDGKQGQIILDQIRTVDKTRLIKKMGSLDKQTAHVVLQLLQEMFQ
ncbi:MAG: type II toxin-antitoxin system PemK/MazF family toxin [Candidatus Babeliales bacterium]